VYIPFLTIHSWLRWATLLLAIGATFNALRPDTDLSQPMPGRHWDTLFMMALDVQVLFGVMLYFGMSPFTMQAFKDMGAAIGDPGLRFWTFDHIAWMAAATVLVRVGRVLALGATSAAKRRKWRLLFFALTALAILIGIPWPGLGNGRPLFRSW
jgi:hypothetical protein